MRAGGVSDRSRRVIGILMIVVGALLIALISASSIRFQASGERSVFQDLGKAGVLACIPAPVLLFVGWRMCRKR